MSVLVSSSIGVIDYFKIVGGGIASFIPEGVRDFEYSRIAAESTRLSTVDNIEYEGIDDYSVGNGKGWTLSLPSYDNVKAGLSIPTGGELVDFANAMYGQSLSASNAYRAEIDKGNFYRAGLAFGGEPIAQGLGLMVGTFGLTRSLSASGRLAPNKSTSPIELLNDGIQGDAIDPAYFARMKAAFERNGGIIDQSTDAQAYLKMRGNAEGLTFNEKTVLLPENPTRSAVFEEFIHTSQHRRGLVNDYAQKYGNSGAELRLEIEAAERLINNRKAWQLPNNETRQTIQRLRDMRHDLLERQ